ncbi:helix-turn-helix transcriptional regulator [Pectobacteriaceae bacterium CE90]|nr:helix-turn-helix transcriptional regulator [Prodigiosinella sp. LS101]WJV52000.1 helix-turn-helix transcriptional regulator [Prodigiosinella sp. LS101]WJV56357.1 helix-turn-helix transcriptional regulator [Pectobacteriaceae bacterium C111]WJY16845.1 helix-turn-helix transcriptional regulator [Pectobacteriaceae bacterium CE90]
MAIMNVNPQSEAEAPPTIQNNRKVLGTFLRSRRESLDPRRLGLAVPRKRRTPGLRREDVALLADVGITWYTWLEQGRPIRTSVKTLTAIADALQFNEVETRHLFMLAGLPFSPSVQASCEKISAASQRILDQLNPFPAVIVNARFTILGFNQSWCRLLNIDLRQIPLEDRNCIYLALTHQGWREHLVDLHEFLPNIVAMFRAQMAEHAGDRRWESQLQRYLAVSEEFRQLWQQHYEIQGVDDRVKRFYHPDLGIISLRQINWWTASRNGDRMLVYMPAEEQDQLLLDTLATFPAPNESK